MNIKLLSVFINILLFCFSGISTAGEEHEHHHHHAEGMLVVKQAWSPSVAPTVSVRAGYFTLINPSNKPIKLMGVVSDMFGAVHMHETMVKDGLASMNALDEIVVEPGEEIVFEPKGKHLMLMQPTEDEIPNIIPLKFLVENAEPIEVDLIVEKKAMMAHGHHHQ